MAPTRPPVIAVLEFIGRILNRFGRDIAPLDPDLLISLAQKKTGLTDWGAAAFRPTFETLVESMELEADLNFAGKVVLQRLLLRGLTNRLKIQKTLEDHAEVASVEIKKPIFIFGMPRSGTTLLHNLFAQASNARVPRYWEIVSPAPPPTESELRTDRRIQRAKRESFLRSRWLLPEMEAIHYIRANSPEECHLLFQIDFSTPLYALYWNCPRYFEHLMAKNMRDSYQYFRSILQILKWKTAGEYMVMKSPHHLFHLDALFEVFPDGRFIQLHRNPHETIASSCSMFATLRKSLTNGPDLQQTGEQILKVLERGVAKTINCRKTAPDIDVCDVAYTDLVADPVACFSSICRHFQLECDAATQNRVGDWVAANHHHKHGVHRYSLEEFGLVADRVDKRLEEYRDWYEDLRFLEIN